MFIWLMTNIPKRILECIYFSRACITEVLLNGAEMTHVL